MKDLVGIRVKFLVDGVKVEGVVVQDRADRVLVKTDEGKIPRVIKSKVSLFIPETEPEDFIPLQLLYCQNAEIKCPGVQYVAEGEKLENASFTAFMGPCPKRIESCRCGTKGDLRSLSSATLKRVMSGMLFGDYPEIKATKGEKK